VRSALSVDGTVRGRALSPAEEYELDAPVTGMGFLATGALAVGLGDGSMRLIVPGQEPLAAWPHAAGSAVLTLAVDPDGRSVLTAGDDGRLIRTSEKGDTRVLASFQVPQLDVLAVSTGSDLRAVAAGRELHLLDRAGRRFATHADHPSTISGLAFHPNGGRLAVAHYGGVTLWWVSVPGRTPTRLEWAGSHIGVTWSPDGSTVVTTMQDNELHGWRVSDGQHMRMRGYATKIRSLTWLAKPLMLVTSGADRVIGWRFGAAGPEGAGPVEAGVRRGRLVTSVAAHPTKPCVAAGFDDGLVRVCSAADDSDIDFRAGSDDRVDGLTWSPDGSWLASATELGKVTLFETRTDLH
jgi:WD40 repeat protein